MPRINPEAVGLDNIKLNRIDSIARDAIEKEATPGCVILVAKDGKVVYNKAFGYFNYDRKEPVTTQSIYDLASVTKICATTISIMKLYDEGKIDLKKRLGDYLPWVKGTNKENLVIENVLLHQAGLAPLVWFYKETVDANGMPYPKCYSSVQSDSFNVRVAQNLFLRNDWRDTMNKRMLQSPLTASEKYVYSDIDFIFLGKVIEAVSGMPLDKYVEKEFYKPLGLTNTRFNPLNYFPVSHIAPTEQEKIFRHQLLRGDVHDPAAAMFGGVSGHAGLFSNVADLAILMQMLLNGGEMNGKQYLKKKTVELFTAYHSKMSRRGYGFDKPERDNVTRQEPYPCKSASLLTFGHTGFTGTCVWVDPKYKCIYIFLSNRVTPQSTNEKLVEMNVRSKIQEAIYAAMTPDLLK